MHVGLLSHLCYSYFAWSRDCVYRACEGTNPSDYLESHTLYYIWPRE